MLDNFKFVCGNMIKIKPLRTSSLYGIKTKTMKLCKDLIQKSESEDYILDIYKLSKEILKFFHKRHRSIFRKNKTKLCWDIIMYGNYNPTTLKIELKDDEKARCDILYYVNKIIKIYDNATKSIDTLVYKITCIIDDTFKNDKSKKVKVKEVIVINADELARTKYYIIKNSNSNLMEILKKLSDRKYFFLYDGLNHKAQYMALLQITQATRNFYLSNINGNLHEKINSAIRRINELVRLQHSNIYNLCVFLGIECPPIPPHNRRGNAAAARYNKNQLKQNINNSGMHNGNMVDAYNNLTHYIHHNPGATMSNIKGSREFKKFIGLLRSSVNPNVRMNPSIKRILNFGRNMNTGAQYNASVNHS